MIHCSSTINTCKCTIVECSVSARSYRGKIIGGILSQIILRTVIMGKMGPYPVVMEDCDNDGAVRYGNKPPILSLWLRPMLMSSV